MDIESVLWIFMLFSGEESSEYEPIVEMSMVEVEKMLLPDADTEDVRLNYLCAALANYRYHQVMCSREHSAVTFAGKMRKSENDISISYAEKLFRDYKKMCGDLLKPVDFVFLSFSKGDDVSNA